METWVYLVDGLDAGVVSSPDVGDEDETADVATVSTDQCACIAIFIAPNLK